MSQLTNTLDAMELDAQQCTTIQARSSFAAQVHRRCQQPGRATILAHLKHLQQIISAWQPPVLR